MVRLKESTLRQSLSNGALLSTYAGGRGGGNGESSNLVCERKVICHVLEIWWIARREVE